MISPVRQQGYIDHQTLSSDAYLKFIEDDFLGSARLNPADGWPAGSAPGHPGKRADGLATSSLDFNFNQQPRAPVLLPTNPPTDSPSIPKYFSGQGPCDGCTVPPHG